MCNASSASGLSVLKGTSKKSAMIGPLTAKLCSVKASFSLPRQLVVVYYIEGWTNG